MCLGVASAVSADCKTACRPPSRRTQLQPGADRRKLNAINSPPTKKPKTRSRWFSSKGLMPAAYTAFLPLLMFFIALLLSVLIYKCAGNVPYAPGP